MARSGRCLFWMLLLLMVVAAMTLSMGVLTAHGAPATVVVPPGPIVEATTPTPGVAQPLEDTPTPTATPTPDPLEPTPTPTDTAVPASTNTPAPTSTPVPTGTPVCGTVANPCYTALALPLIDEQGGGGMMGLLVLFGLVVPFLRSTERIIIMLSIVAAVGLFVASGMLGWLFAPPFLLICIVPLREVLSFLAVDR